LLPRNPENIPGGMLNMIIAIVIFNVLAFAALSTFFPRCRTARGSFHGVSCPRRRS